MIVSVSRRTDIPAFYGEWFARRLQAGFCLVPNPFNPRQVARVGLSASEVEALVFWTRNPRPFMKHLPALEDRGLPFLFLFTLLDAPRLLEPHAPHLAVSLRTFCDLAARIGPERVVWRYDPIVLSTATDCDYHCRAFERIATRLQGATRRCIVSFFEPYKKLRLRLAGLARSGFELLAPRDRDVEQLLRHMAACSASNHMVLQSCAQEMDLEALGIVRGACIDAELLSRISGRVIATPKDPCQRTHCACVASKDIGMYDTCLFGCAYCYATSSFARARENFKRHDPNSPALLPLLGAVEMQLPLL